MQLTKRKKEVSVVTARMMYILGKYKVVDGNKIIAQNLEELKELAQSGVSAALGVKISYAPQSKKNKAKSIGFVKKHKLFSFGILFTFVSALISYLISTVK